MSKTKRGTKIEVMAHTGEFAEDKDKAQQLRESLISPTVEAGGKVVIDFKGVTGATQSFVHALISKPIRTTKGAVLDQLDFKNCNRSVQRIITIVAEYSQQTADRE
jgi:hypothetical protein